MSTLQYTKSYSEGEAPLLNKEQAQENFDLITADAGVLENLFLKPGISSDWNTGLNLPLPYSMLCTPLQPYDRLLLILCIGMRLFPEKLRAWTDSCRNGITITNYKLGGYISSSSAQFLPSLQTAIYLCAGDNEFNALEMRKYFLLFSPLLRSRVITLEPFTTTECNPDEATFIPTISQEYFDYLLYGREVRPDFGKDFPAQLICAEKNWNDLMLDAPVLSQIANIGALFDVQKEFKKLGGKKFRKGITCLFYGPPGTGKTLTAKLLGKKHNRRVFRVDLSATVDKYIGETEKKLATLFDRMEMFPGSILLFDESDVLFGKRTHIGDSKDRWANLLTGFLLQRIENYDGISILTSNRKEDIDPAMMRRFDAVINFRNPDVRLRKQLWQTLLPEGFLFEDPFVPEEFSNYELSGGQIENVMKLSVASAVVSSETTVRRKTMEMYVMLELAKEGLTMPKRNVTFRSAGSHNPANT